MSAATKLAKTSNFHLFFRGRRKAGISRSDRVSFAILGWNIMHKTLILDKRAGTLALQLCRALARRGYWVDILGTRTSIAFSSRYCARALKLPSWNPERIGRYLRRVS